MRKYLKAEALHKKKVGIITSADGMLGRRCDLHTSHQTTEQRGSESSKKQHPI